MIEKFTELPVMLCIYLAVTAVMSLITFLTFGIDKIKSKFGISIGLFKLTFNRVPEKTLLTLSFWGGSLGAMLGMLIFRHKSRKDRFRIWIPIHLILWCLLGLFVIEKGPGIVNAVISFRDALQNH